MSAGGEKSGRGARAAAMTQLTRCGPARDRGTFGGRPRALKVDEVAAAWARLKGPDIPVSEVVRRLKVSPLSFTGRFPVAGAVSKTG